MERYARALGDEFVRDWVHLRTGEVWSERLKELIAQADVFQLFWSHHSMRSPFVRQEWEYALSLGRPRFVRPTYWEDPLPSSPAEGLPPEALLRLHFQRLHSIVTERGWTGAGASQLDVAQYVRMLVVQARKLAERGEIREALALAEEAVILSPHDPRALRLRDSLQQQKARQRNVPAARRARIDPPPAKAPQAAEVGYRAPAPMARTARIGLGRSGAWLVAVAIVMAAVILRSCG